MIARTTYVQRVICLLLVIVFAACSTDAAPAPAPTSPSGAAGTGITLVLWHGWSSTRLQALSRLVERFNRQHSNGRITLQSIPLPTFDGDLQDALAYGSGPQIVLLPNTWIGSLAEQDALLPIDDAIAPAEQQTFLPPALGGARARGPDGKPHLYGLPVSFDTLALYYDKRNFLAAPADTAELVRTARGLSDPNAPRWGLAINLSLDNTIGYLYAAGGRIFNDDGKVVLGSAGRAGAEQWLSWLQQLKDDSQLLARADSSIQVDRELNGGHVLLTFDWARQIDFYRSLWAEHLGVAPLPRLTATNQPPQPYVKSDVLAINRRAGVSERKAALEFLRFMTSVEAQTELLKNELPPARSDLKLDAAGLDSAQLMAAQAFRSQAATGQPMPNVPTREREILRKELTRMLWQVLRDEASPAEAVTEADQHLREQLWPANQ